MPVGKYRLNAVFENFAILQIRPWHLFPQHTGKCETAFPGGVAIMRRRGHLRVSCQPVQSRFAEAALLFGLADRLNHLSTFHLYMRSRRRFAHITRSYLQLPCRPSEFRVAGVCREYTIRSNSLPPRAPDCRERRQITTAYQQVSSSRHGIPLSGTLDASDNHQDDIEA